jgi:DNA-binding transcriptional MerR regulator
MQVGKGRGSRRLYTERQIYRIALADLLVTHGFSASTVGKAMREVPESVLVPHTDASLHLVRGVALKDQDIPILLMDDTGDWQLIDAKVARQWTKNILQPHLLEEAMVVINLANFTDITHGKIQKYRAAQGLMKEHEVERWQESEKAMTAHLHRKLSAMLPRKRDKQFDSYNVTYFRKRGLRGKL